ncbi:MAG: hypothetical protein RLZZ293_574 [Pseudomonadota bacterium]|jgi:tRNA dimethylallyltransferase
MLLKKNNNSAILLMGPTAVGKTQLALRLGQYYPIEIISVDSALVYQDLDIGSAKPSHDELQSVPHHLINIISPLENYSVAQFLAIAKQLVKEVCQRGNLPVLVGGTMMYYNSLLNGLSQLPEANSELRLELDNQFTKFGNVVMHQRLMKIDPNSATKISCNDRQRIQRALEVCLMTNLTMKEAQAKEHINSLVEDDIAILPLAIVPNNRHLLHERINLRFLSMLDNGFIQEVEMLQQKYPTLTAKHNSMRCVGYRQVWEYLATELTYLDMVANGQASTRQLAKRQITWLRSLPIIALDDELLNVENLYQQLVRQFEQFYACQIS